MWYELKLPPDKDGWCLVLDKSPIADRWNDAEWLGQFSCTDNFIERERERAAAARAEQLREQRRQEELRRIRSMEIETRRHLRDLAERAQPRNFKWLDEGF